MGKSEITTLLYSFWPFCIGYLNNPWKPYFRVKQFFSWLKTFFFQLMSFQRLNKAPLEPWVIARISAEILSEHYNYGWLGRDLYACFILAVLPRKFNKNVYCKRTSCLLGCTIKSKPYLTTSNSGHWLSSTKKKKIWNCPLYSRGSITGWK